MNIGYDRDAAKVLVSVARPASLLQDIAIERLRSRPFISGGIKKNLREILVAYLPKCCSLD